MHKLLQIALIGYLIWQSVGVAAIVGLIVLIVQTLPIQGYLSHLGGKLRSQIANKTDERVQLMSELISGIRVGQIWEYAYISTIAKSNSSNM